MPGTVSSKARMRQKARLGSVRKLVKLWPGGESALRPTGGTMKNITFSLH